MSIRTLVVGLSLIAAGCEAPESSERTRTSPETQPVGTTPDPSTGDPTATSPKVEGPTWHQDIAPLLADRCGACHIEGGVGPFSIETYESTAAWGFAIDDAVQSGRMPPFFADETECAMPAPLKDDVACRRRKKT